MHLNNKSLASLAVVLLCVSAALADDYSVKKLEEKPPVDEMPKAIAGQLDETGYTVTKGEETTLANIWFTKEWDVKEGFSPTLDVLYGFKPGHLVGVIQWKRKGADFRDQEIARGVYTLRYALQPNDGNHVGTSPTRDFLLMVEAAKDEAAEPMEAEKLSQLSAEAAESTHPAMLALQLVPTKADQRPAIHFQERNEFHILRATGKSKAGKPVDVDIVVVGHADE